ncbi:MAG: exo-alpha-sialidase [Clostridia bacterium]|nr:exo-alpha-sialidase [Clostridia bacterium]
MKNTLVRQTDETYSNYRIPGIVITRKNTVLTYYEARRTASDWAHMDILLYRSEDGGETFSDAVVMARGTDEFPTVNNPVCIVDEDNTIHFIYCRNYSIGGGDVFYRRSEDDGKTWSEPRNIMAMTRPEVHNVFACGPGHGIRTKDGTLLVPVWMVKKDAGAPLFEHHPGTVSTLFSHDRGETWQLGEEIPAQNGCNDPNETQAALLSDGRVYLNVRTTATGYRAYTVSENGYEDWLPLTLDRTLPDPTCFGSTASAVVSGHHILAVVNCADDTERRNLVCHFSYDDGKTWADSVTVEPDDAGYADIAMTEDGTVYVLYEQEAGIRDRLAVFPIPDMGK